MVRGQAVVNLSWAVQVEATKCRQLGRAVTRFIAALVAMKWQDKASRASRGRAA